MQIWNLSNKNEDKHKHNDQDKASDVNNVYSQTTLNFHGIIPKACLGKEEVSALIGKLSVRQSAQVRFRVEVSRLCRFVSQATRTNLYASEVSN